MQPPIAISGDRRAPSRGIELLFVCPARGKKGADTGLLLEQAAPVAMMRYRQVRSD